MSKYVYEAHKYADEACQDREREEAFGRLRLALFWGFLGTMAITVVTSTHYTPPRWLALAILGTAPVAVVVFIINYLRLPTDCKVKSSTLIMGFITLTFAVATTALMAYSH